MARPRGYIAVALASILATAGAAIALPVVAQAAADPDCGAFDDPVYYRVNPEQQVGLLSPWEREISRASSLGFTVDHGTLVQASVQDVAGLRAVHRLHRLDTNDYLYTISPGEVTSAAALGYVDEGSSFSVSPTAADCLAPVYRYERGGRHQVAVTDQDRDELVAAGWEEEGVSFYAGYPSGAQPDPEPEPEPAPEPEPGPAPDPGGDSTFTFAVLPDTQQEVLRSGDSRFVGRSRWLASQKSALNLKFVAHTGDVVNWDTPNHSQYEMASAAMRPLEAAGIPYTLSIGNHDTQATGPGGGARDPSRTRSLQRDTTTFNRYFSAARYRSVAGAYESGKVDNIYSTYNAGGRKWLVLVLELWPRDAVVEWAKRVVAEHPDHNVIVTTHSYVSGSGAISGGPEYGDTSARELWERLISRYANIRFVFSGHVGTAASRVDTGVHGNKILSYNQTFHSLTTNPVRLVQVDADTGTVKSWIYGPHNKQTFSQYGITRTGVSFVR